VVKEGDAILSAAIDKACEKPSFVHNDYLAPRFGMRAEEGAESQAIARCENAVAEIVECQTARSRRPELFGLAEASRFENGHVALRRQQ
jgi:hypothetical protein